MYLAVTGSVVLASVAD